MKSRNGYLVADVLVAWALEDVTSGARQAGRVYHARLVWFCCDPAPALGSTIPGNVAIREIS